MLCDFRILVSASNFMHEFVSLGGRIILASEAFVSSLSAATFYGRGIFTTLAVYRSTPFQWEKHWNRIESNAAVIGLDLDGLTEDAIKNSLSEIIERNQLINGRARLTFFDNSLKGVWNYPANLQTSSLITTADFRKVSADLRLTLAPFPLYSKGALVGVKSCNYLENILSLEGARKAGFDEAVRVNENGEIVSAMTANILWTSGGEIFTPPLESGALAGTTRSFLLENFPIIERKANLSDLKKADEIILTSAGLGIAKIGIFDDRSLIEKKLFMKISEHFAATCRALGQTI